jgi:CubicO group peptidase (beta-lactamase class C family)
MKKSFNSITFLILIVLCGFSANLYSQNNLPEATIKSVDSVFSFVNRAGSPGCAIAIIMDGKIVFEKGYGYANLENNVPISPMTLFNLASVSKQFSAFSILLLAEQGKLSIDDDIRKYIPEFTDLTHKITIRQLIHHTSGLRDYEELLMMKGLDPKDYIGQEDMLKIMLNQQDLNNPPGERFLYSNTNYTLLAEIVKRVSGKDYPIFAKENIFDPLKMNSTIVRNNLELVIKDKAESYHPEGKDNFRVSLSNNACYGQGNIFSNVEDLTKWINNYHDIKVGSRKIIDQMIETGILNNGKKINYAFGLTVNDFHGIKEISHTGGRAGYRTVLAFYPEQKFGVIILSNLSFVVPANLARRVSHIFLNKFYAPEKPKTQLGKEIFTQIENINKYTGNYESAPRMIMKVSMSGDTLYANLLSMPKFQLFAESKDVFFNNSMNIRFKFSEFQNGKFLKISIAQEDDENEWKRKESYDSSKTQLSDFGGEYYSDELKTFYYIRAESGKLIIRHNGFNDNKLRPVYKDEFAGSKEYFDNIRFIRDEKNHVNGFFLFSGRAWYVRFVKINN